MLALAKTASGQMRESKGAEVEVDIDDSLKSRLGGLFMVVREYSFLEVES